MGELRPNIVWFGEMPMHLDEIYEVLERCGLFLAIGTSGEVYPAAGFVLHVRRHAPRAHTVELNLEPTDNKTLFQEHIYGPATEIVPPYVDARADAGLAIERQEETEEDMPDMTSTCRTAPTTSPPTRTARISMRSTGSSRT